VIAIAAWPNPAPGLARSPLMHCPMSLRVRQSEDLDYLALSRHNYD